MQNWRDLGQGAQRRLGRRSLRIHGFRCTQSGLRGYGVRHRAEAGRPVAAWFETRSFGSLLTMRGRAELAASAPRAAPWPRGSAAMGGRAARESRAVALDPGRGPGVRLGRDDGSAVVAGRSPAGTEMLSRASSGQRSSRPRHRACGIFPNIPDRRRFASRRRRAGCTHPWLANVSERAGINRGHEGPPCPITRRRSTARC